MVDAITDIQKTELELRRLQQSIIGLTNLKDKEEMEKREKQLDFDQETVVMNILEKTDKAYDSIVQENFDLLINNWIEFEVKNEEGKIKSHAMKFDGKLSDDGLFYCNTYNCQSC